MLKNPHKIWLFASCLVFVAMLTFCVAADKASPAAANRNDSPAEKQRQLIRVLKSDAPPGEKTITCKQLAVYGTSDAVPALAPLLSDQQLASWARIALEAIPGPAADDALRRAMGKLHGKLLIGTINSIGYRRDPKAVSALVKKLKDADAEVASASADALGHIGGAKASRGLERALTEGRAGVLPKASDKVAADVSRRTLFPSNNAPGVVPAVAQGCILCAERFLADGKSAEAVKLYDLVRQADVPRQKVLEATRGAILARKSDGLPLLLELLRSNDKAMFGLGLRTARELPGREVTEALAAELGRCRPDRQAFLLLALADRGDSAVLPTVLQAARSGPQKLRLVAVGVLDRFGNVSSVPVLLNTAAENDIELTHASLAALARLHGNEVDADFLARLPQSAGRMRQVLIELAMQRRMESALPAIGASLENADAGVRAAAVKAIGALGGDKQIADLVRLLPSIQTSKERDDIEAALIAISGRRGAACVPTLLPLPQSDDSALRIIGLHALAGAGGPEALAIVKSAVEDKDETVQDEAVRTLSMWPNNWPEDRGVAEPLLALARSGKKSMHQVLGLRGYLQYVKEDNKFKDDEKVARITELLPLLTRPEDKRLAIAAIDAVSTGAALDLLVTFAAEPAIAEEASSALINIANKDRQGLTKDQRRKALQTVVEKSQNDATRKKAEKLLKELK